MKSSITNIFAGLISWWTTAGFWSWQKLKAETSCAAIILPSSTFVRLPAFFIFWIHSTKLPPLQFSAIRKITRAKTHSGFSSSKKSTNLTTFWWSEIYLILLWNQGRLTKLRESARFSPCVFQLNWLARIKRLDNHVLSSFVVKRKRDAFFGIEVFFVDFTKSSVFLFRVIFSRSF